MAYRERQKISQMTPKGADLSATDLVEISVLESGSYVTKSVTGLQIINAATGGALDLQAVTDNGNTTTNDLIVSVDSPIDNTTISDYFVTTQSGSLDTYTTIDATNGLKLKLGDDESLLKNTNVTNPNVILEFPNKAAGSYTIATTSDLTSGTVTSVDLTMPSAFTVTGNPITTSGTLAVTGAGVVSQYVRGDGSLANFPSVSGGGASTSYYLNGSVSQGTIGGVAYYEMNKTPILGAGTDFIRTNGSGNGYIASFLTDANDPNLLKIPGGNWNLEFYFSASSSGSTPSFYVELYKYNGSTFTLIASNSTNPEIITGGTSTDAYFTSLSVPETVLVATDRLAIRVYVTTAGRTITLHTEDNHLCQVITTFTTGLTALNGLTDQVQNFATGTSGTDFGINSSGSTHTFNLPTASATNRGALSTTDWSAFNGKAPMEVSINTQTVNYTLALSDNYKLIEVNNASARTITIPTNTAVTFPIGTQILISQYGAGQVTIAPDAGVTLRSSGGKTKTAAQYAMATLVKRGTNEWYLAGDITT
jgi:hypothetical protein